MIDLSKIPILPQLKKALEAAKKFYSESLSELAQTAADAIEEVEALKTDKRNAVSITIPTSGWVSDTSVSAYPYRYEISVSSITAKDFVIINISPSSQATATACRLCPTKPLPAKSEYGQRKLRHRALRRSIGLKKQRRHNYGIWHC